MKDSRWILIPGNGIYVTQNYRAQVEVVGERQERTLSIEGKIQNIQLPRGRIPQIKGLSSFDHKGHLIAFRFGGPDHPANLVAMHGLINMSGGLWYQMEARLAEALGERPGEMKVLVQYDDSTDMMRPRSFCVHATNHAGQEFHERMYNFNPHMDGRRHNTNRG
ncbi:MAG: DNA/RNA non-specific endonuclease [Planctomyces sp.]|nr:DNA/RNA non-specific endonuclease [Planctomyces sp.]